MSYKNHQFLHDFTFGLFLIILIIITYTCVVSCINFHCSIKRMHLFLGYFKVSSESSYFCKKMRKSKSVPFTGNHINVHYITNITLIILFVFPHCFQGHLHLLSLSSWPDWCYFLFVGQKQNITLPKYSLPIGWNLSWISLTTFTDHIFKALLYLYLAFFIIFSSKSW